MRRFNRSSMLFLAKPQHLLGKGAIGVSSGILRCIIQNAHARCRTFRNLDRLLNRAVKYMNAVTVDLSHAGANALAELRAGLLHSQENARNLQIGVESILYIAHHF